MPVWGYLVLGFFLVSLTALTLRRNTPVSHERQASYGDDFARVLDETEPMMVELRAAVRAGDERPLAAAASSARSVIHRQIDNLDRLAIPDALGEEGQERLVRIRGILRQAMENYEWAARIAETTDLIENAGLRRGFDTLAGAGDQFCADARFELVGVREMAG